MLEVLREPLEYGCITISRAARQVDFPARFQLIAAMNPCKCGYLGHHSGKCRCTPDQVTQYRGRISGPLLDRIDLHIYVPVLKDMDFLSAPGESSASVRGRVVRAREKQTRRQASPNSRLSGREIEECGYLDAEGIRLLRDATSRMQLSGRAHHRVLKVARTIADLDDSLKVRVGHIAEALLYRGVPSTF